MGKAVRTPVCDFVRGYAGQNPLRLHMPGHKGRGAMETMDITEIQGAPPLYPASGILRESEENAARLFGAGRTVFSTEGSSLCIRAMLFLARMRAESLGIPPVILAGRNAHRTFLSAAALLDLEVAWLRGPSLLTCLPTAEETAGALDGMVNPAAAVYLTSPDYLGFQADISGIAAVCHERKIPLLVDNAHGAYLRFLPEDLHPLTRGADLCCDSAHKTLPALTGAAYLHIHQDAPELFREQAERGMALFASTSPSWLILQSLDRCNAELAEEWPARLRTLLPEIRTRRARLEEKGFRFIGNEPLKWTIEAGSYGYTGDALHDRLRESGIECEFSDPDFLVMMLSPETGKDGLDRLMRAMESIPRKESVLSESPSPPRGVTVLPLRQAMLAPAETLSLNQCLGRILAEPCASCPPAVPILISGEQIDEEAIRCFAYYGVTELSCVRETKENRSGILQERGDTGTETAGGRPDHRTGRRNGWR